MPATRPTQARATALWRRSLFPLSGRGAVMVYRGSHGAVGDITAKPDDGDDEEQHRKRHENPRDGDVSHALPALSFVFHITHHDVQGSGSVLPSMPKPCSTRST